MSNLEFILKGEADSLNPSVRPVYITATNMVLPIINISPMGSPGALLYSIKKIILNILIKILDICYLFITIIGLLIIISRTLAIIYKIYKIK
jgi:hypothetical protein